MIPHESFPNDPWKLHEVAYTGEGRKDLRHPVAGMLSFSHAVFNPADGDLCYANAGHPPPLLATGTGPAEYLDDTDGAMLGASARTRFTAGRRRVRPGSRLLFYTDGLIEDRHRDITDGLAILAETLPGSGLGSAGQTCDTVLAALLGTGRRHDDVCLLTARIAGPDEASRPVWPAATRA